jgi:hypothetical protein
LASKASTIGTPFEEIGHIDAPGPCRRDAKAGQPLGKQTAGQFICCYGAMLIGRPPCGDRN